MVLKVHFALYIIYASLFHSILFGRVRRIGLVIYCGVYHVLRYACTTYVLTFVRLLLSGKWKIRSHVHVIIGDRKSVV